MGNDEQEWVRDVIDRWLSANGPTIGITLALACALGSLLLTN